LIPAAIQPRCHPEAPGSFQAVPGRSQDAAGTVPGRSWIDPGMSRDAPGTFQNGSPNRSCFLFVHKTLESLKLLPVKQQRALGLFRNLCFEGLKLMENKVRNGTRRGSLVQNTPGRFWTFPRRSPYAPWTLLDAPRMLPGRSLDAPGRSLAAPWALLGRSWSSLDAPGTLLDAPGRSLDAPGRSWTLLGRSWTLPGRSPGAPGTLLGRSWDAPGQVSQ